MFSQLRPGATFGDGERFLSPPPLAWLVAPLTALGPAGAYAVWLVVSLLALVAAWWLAAPGEGWTRSLWLLGALAWYPLLYSLALGQPAALVLLAVVAGWRLAEAGRPHVAGAVIGLSVVKPQLTIAVPLVLLAAGRWRIAAAWAVTAAALAAASAIAIGGSGLGDYQQLLAEAQAVANNRYFTLADIVGPGPLSYVAAAVVMAIALIGAYVNRRAALSHLIALGLVASAVSATYWHLQDFAILVGAVWLFCRERRPAWQGVWLLVAGLAAELAWPLRPVPVLVAVAVWFVVLVLPRRAVRLQAAA